MTLKEYWHKNKKGLLLMIGILGTVIALSGLWELLIEFDQVDRKYEVPLLDQIDMVAWFFIIIGAIIAIGGFLYHHDINKRYRKFVELMDTDSKAAFIRNLPEIEECAIDLGPEYEAQVIEKRKKLKVKTR